MKKHTVLIVDDEVLVLKSILRALRNENYKILTAQSGEKGLNVMKDCEVENDLKFNKFKEITPEEHREMIKKK